MEATHFIEFYRFFGKSGIYTSGIKPIKELQKELTMTLIYGETIAVWRIKPTDVPIEERLAKRLGSPIGYCSAGFFRLINEMMYADTKL